MFCYTIQVISLSQAAHKCIGDTGAFTREIRAAL
jgi:hypothetical protein